jgi:hypothetical protein
MAWTCRFQRASPQDLLSEATESVVDLVDTSIWGYSQGKRIWELSKKIRVAPEVPGGFRVLHKTRQPIGSFFSTILLTLFSAPVDDVLPGPPRGAPRMPVAGSMEVERGPGRTLPVGKPRPQSGAAAPGRPCDFVAHFGNSDGFNFGMERYVTMTMAVMTEHLARRYPANSGWTEGTGIYTGI